MFNLLAHNAVYNMIYWNSPAILQKYVKEIIQRWMPVGLFQLRLQSKKAYCDRASLETPRRPWNTVARSFPSAGRRTLLYIRRSE